MVMNIRLNKDPPRETIQEKISLAKLILSLPYASIEHLRIYNAFWRKLQRKNNLPVLRKKSPEIAQDRSGKVTIDWIEDTSSNSDTSNRSPTSKKDKVTVLISEDFLKQSLKKIGVEEQLLLFAREIEEGIKGDYIIWRSKKPDLKAHSMVNSSSDPDSLFKALETTIDYGDGFIGLIHRHPGPGEPHPSGTDWETQRALEIYDHIFGGIVDKKSDYLKIFHKYNLKFEVVGNGYQRKNEKDDVWKLKDER